MWACFIDDYRLRDTKKLILSPSKGRQRVHTVRLQDELSASQPDHPRQLGQDFNSGLGHHEVVFPLNKVDLVLAKRDLYRAVHARHPRCSFVG